MGGVWWYIIGSGYSDGVFEGMPTQMKDLLIEVHGIHINSIPRQRTRGRRRPAPPRRTRPPRSSGLLRRRKTLLRLERTLIRLQQNLLSPAGAHPRRSRIPHRRRINHEIIIVAPRQGVPSVPGKGTLEFIENAV